MAHIKVLRLITRLNIGGPTIHVVTLTSDLDTNSFVSLLACGSISADEGDMSYYATERNIPVHVIPELTRQIKPWKDICALIKIFTLIRKEKPDIIHTHTAKAGTLGRIAGAIHNMLTSRDKKAFLVHTFHGHVFDGYFNSLANKIIITIERIIASFTDTIIAISPTIRQEIISLRITSAKKITLIPLGFDLERFKAIQPVTNPTTISIGIIGRLVPIKNHQLFINAAGKLIGQKISQSVEFKIIGDGETKKDLIRLTIEKNLTNVITFMGWQRNLEHVYASLSIVCLTSFNEGTPVSLIEGMSCGLPVVSTDAGGVKDLLGEEMPHPKSSKGFAVCQRGILVKDKSPESFADALALLIEDASLRAQLGATARKFAQTSFTKTTLIHTIADLYTKLLSQR